MAYSARGTVSRRLALASLLLSVLFSSSVLALNLDVSVTNNPVQPNGLAYYRIVVSNSDGATRNNVVVSAAVPENAFFNENNAQPPTNGSCSSASCNSGESGIWELGSLASGASRVIVVPLIVSGTAADDDELELAVSANYDGLGTPETATGSSRVDSTLAGRVSTTASRQIVEPDQTLRYEVSFGNMDSTGMTEPTLRARVPAGTTFANASDGGALDGNFVVWDLDVLNAGEGGKRFYTVTVSSPQQSGTILNSGAELLNGSTSISLASESVVIREEVDLTLDVTKMGDRSLPGDFTYYRYIVANKGSTTLTDVTLELMVAERTFFYEVATAPVTTSNCSSNFCAPGEWGNYAIGELGAGESWTLTVPVQRQSPRNGEPLVSHALLTEGSGAFTQGTRPTMISSNDLSLELAVSSERQVVGAGEQHRYEVSYGNVDDSAYQNLVLTVDLPEGTSFVSASDGGQNAGGQVTWDLQTLNAGDGNQRWFTVTAPDEIGEGEVLITEARLDTGDEALALASESVVIREGVDLTLDVTKMGDRSLPGDFTYYRYIVANKGSTTLTDVTLELMVAERTFFYEVATAPVTTSNCSSNFCAPGEWGNYAIGELGAGESWTLTVPVQRQSPRNGEPLVSHALLTEGSGAFTQGTRPTMISSNDLSLELAVSSERQVVGAGEQHRYEVSYGNVDDSAYQNLVLTVDLPEGTSFVSASDGGQNAGGQVTWDLQTLNAGDGNQRWFTVTAPDEIGEGEVLITEARLDTGDEALALASESVVIREGVDLTLDVTKMGDRSLPGDFTYYRYIVANKGSTTLTDVTLELMVAERTFFYEVATAPVTTSNCSSNFCAPGEWGNYAIGELGAGESWTLTVPVQRQSPRNGEPLVSHALLTEGSGAFTQGTRPTMISSNDLSLELAVSSERQVVGAGEQHRYEVSYGNVDDSAYQNLVLTVDLPEGTSFVSASDGGQNAGGQVTWDLQTLNAGDGNQRWFTVTAPDEIGEGEVLITEARLDTGDEALALASESVVIREGVDLTLDVTKVGDRSLPGDFTYYRYIVANKGSTTLTDVTLELMVAERTFFYEVATAPVTTSNCSSNFCAPGEWGNYAIGELGAGESWTLTVPVQRQSARNGEPLISHALLTEGSGAFTQGTRPTVIASDEPDLQLALVADQFDVAPGGSRSVDLFVGNPTDSAFQNLVLELTLPDTLGASGISGNGENVGNTISWPLGNLSAGEWVSQSIILNVPGSVALTESFQLRSRIVGDSGIGQLATAELTGLVTDEALTFDASIGSTDSPITNGSELTVSLNHENATGTQYTDVRAHVLMPIGSSANVADSGVAGCTSNVCNSGEWGNWNIGDLDDGVASSNSLTGAVNTDVPGQLLIGAAVLSHSTAPSRDPAVFFATGVGSVFEVDPNHDSDGDGIPDWWEIRWGYDRLDAADASTDDDNDGSTNLDEYQDDTLPDNPDTDGDGILDGDEGSLVAVANAGADQSVTEGDMVSLDATGSDLEGDSSGGAVLSYAWNQTEGPVVSLTDGETATPSFTAPDVDGDTNLSFTLTVEGPDSTSDTDSVTVTVSPQDEAPNANAGPDQPSGGATIFPGDTVQLNGSNSSDVPDSLVDLTFAWTGSPDDPAVTLSDATSTQPTFTAPDLGEDGGVLEFTLTVTDTAGQSDTDTVLINISGFEPPVADAGPDQSVDVGEEVSLSGLNSSDPDGEIDGYLWTQTDGTIVTLTGSDTASAVFTAPDVAGTALIFELEVTDSQGLMDSDSVTVNVVEGAKPIPECRAGDDQTLQEYTGGEITLVVLDASGSGISEGSIASYGWNQISGPDVTLDDTSSAETGFLAPEVPDAGASLVFEVTCTSDQGVESGDRVTVNITDVNRPPQASAGQDQQNVPSDSQVMLDASASMDPDGDSIAFLWTQTGGPSVTLSDTSTASPTFIAPDAPVGGVSLIFEITVDDGDLEASDEVTVTVFGSNTPPIAQAVSDESVVPGAVVTLDASGSSDAETETENLRVTWTQKDGPEVALSDRFALKPTFGAPAVEEGEIVLIFEVAIEDAGGEVARDQVSISVVAADSDDDGSGSSSGGGGGGCSLGQPGAPDPTLPAIAMGALLWILRRKRKESI